MYGKTKLTKLTKRQIKEDKFTVFMLKVRDQFLHYWQYTVIGLVVVILLVIGIVYYINSQQARTQEAAAKFARALIDYRMGNNQLAILSMSQIIDEYGDKKVAEQATFMLGVINYQTRNYPEAIRYYEMYLSKYRDNKLNRAAAKAGIAASLENQGQYREAAEGFVAACDEYPDGPSAGDYHFSAMRNFLEVGEIDEAQAHLDIIKNEYEGSQLVNRAIRLFSEKART
ncbi:MAG: tol-pal system YbgF family protein [Candidatus Zixiibacteriota bacterium]